MEVPKFKIGVLASGGGTTFEAVHNAIEVSPAHRFLEIDFVVCNNGPNNPHAKVWERAQRLGVPIVHISNATQETCTLPAEGAISEEASKEIARFSEERGVRMLAALGCMKRIIGPVLEQFSIVNTHPGPLGPNKLTAGEHGEGVQKKVMELGLTHSGPTLHWMSKELDEDGLPAYDMGTEIGHEPVEVTGAMRDQWQATGEVDLLQTEVQRIERLWVPRWIAWATDQVA